MPNWKKIVVSGSDAELNSLNVTTSLTASGNIYPTNLGVDRQIIKTDGLGNLSFGYSEEIVAIVKNVSGVTLLKGTPVHATQSGAMGNVVGVIAASASNAATMPATFVLNETLIDEAEGDALASGFIQGVDTSAFEVGDVVYVGENGGYTNVKPTGSNRIQNLGIVTKVDAVNGSGFVLGAGRANDVPNINPGYLWVGNSDWVATPTPTSSLSVASAVSASYALTSSYPFIGNGSNIYSANTIPQNGGSIAIGENAFSASSGAGYASVAIGYRAGMETPNADQLIFIGNEAGRQMSNSDTVIAIGGYQTGYQANEIDSSILLGRYAGQLASNSRYGFWAGEYAAGEISSSNDTVAIGSAAGYLATNSPFSVILGYGAGNLIKDSGDSILIGNSAGNNLSGSNNIIIGKGITFPQGTTSSLNIGGAIFASGLNDSNFPMLSGSVANPRVGIGVVSPTLANLQVAGNVYATSYTGSLFGTASYATQALSASWAPGGGSTFPYTGSAIISGSLEITGSFSVNNGTATKIDTSISQLLDDTSIDSVDWQNRYLLDTAGNISSDWTNRVNLDSSGNTSIDWENRVLWNTNGIIVDYSGTSSLNIINYRPTAERLELQAQDDFTQNAIGTSIFNAAGNLIETETNIATNVSSSHIVYLDSDGVWKQTNQTTDTSTKMLGICIQPWNKGLVLLEGIVNVTTSSAVLDVPLVAGSTFYGMPVYLTGSAAKFTTNKPTSGYVRVAGHMYYNSTTTPDYWIMKFNPSNDWYQI